MKKIFSILFLMTTLFCNAQDGRYKTIGLIPTTTKSANYTVAVNDFVPCDVSGGSFTLTLPTAPIDGSIAEAKIINSNSINIIVVKTGGSDVFNKVGGATQGTIA